MFNKKFFLIIGFYFLLYNCAAQKCGLVVEGNVYDKGTGSPLSYVTVFVQEMSTGTVTDDEGHFEISDVCSGEYHFTFSHIGCESKKVHFELTQDTIFNVFLPHSSTSLSTVVIEGVTGDQDKQPRSSINRQTLEDNTNRNLAALLKNEAGVNLVKNGSGISKPVVHGLYGNRLTILNNGIIQSGQQWGNDHSPEIDPFAADKIVVLKGSSAIEYGAGNLGGVILIEPKKIEKEPHTHGQMGYFHETNGRGHGFNTRIEKYTSAFAWRLSGTFKKYGDKKTADYFLNNTGLAEANVALQIEKNYDDKLFVEAYASTFNTSLGVLRGSHIGNITDLQQALEKEVPFFTEPEFSYLIESPKQRVSHHLVKGKIKYYLTENEYLDFVVANQINDRKEFDIRRNDRSDLPALSLKQYATNFDLKYTNYFQNGWILKLGSQNIITDNTNNPETGILPLIPDYLSWKSGVFSTLTKSMDRVLLNLGARYDYEYQNVLTISSTIPREIIRFQNGYQNVSGLFALKYELSNTQSVALNAGYAMRNPGINELYSNGLHQGVSGIEEGSIDLETERAFKNTLEYKWYPGANFSVTALAYHQRFSNYIFLNPQDEIRLTIRGAFPVFRYEQTDADIYGFDLSTEFTIGDFIFGNINYSHLVGRDTKNNIPLIFMPPNSLFGSLVYRPKRAKLDAGNVLLEETEFEINNRLVFQQTNILSEQDFVDAPPTYNLIGAQLSTNILFSTYKIRCYLKADNLLNVQYRDYLNRQRYFADDTGVSVTMGVNFKF